MEHIKNMMQSNIYKITWSELRNRIHEIDKTNNTIYGIPRGGMLCCLLLKKAKTTINPECANYIIDDINDSGKTKEKWMKKYPNKKYFALVDKKGLDKNKGWIQFPWENKSEENDYLIRILQFNNKPVNDENINKLKNFVLNL